GLDDAALSVAYARASVFVWPSRLEGFGMPPLEMMLTGGAVASSSAVCMPEILGDAPAYFAPDDAGGLADAAQLLLRESPDERANRGKRGRERAESFTCRRMADETIAVWESAARSHEP
ncbi:MAG: glycosyltransferase, partial [Armatimonadetes bacterium]|nr:glycosyltransferase [Armatimonadota bacterium]